jgi:putative transposase
MPIHSTKPTSFLTIERKLYPNVEQAKVLETYRVECCRVYNRALEQRIKAYKRRGESVTLYAQQALLTEQRQRINKLREVPTEFARDALRRLDRGFKAFFRRVKSKAKRKGFPRFRSRHRYQSMEYLAVGNYFRDGSVHVPGVGEVTARGRNASGKQKMLRLIKRIDGWYAQTLVEMPMVPTVVPQTSVGIDVGLNSFATLSDGKHIDNPRWYRKSQAVLRRSQKSLSRKVKGSRNRRKAVKRLARQHEKIAAQRKDFAHQESRNIVNRFDLIGFEKLNISGLAQGKLAKSILDAAWGAFLYFIVYKAANAGRLAVPVEAAGTSQECPSCGMVKKKSLSERHHQCECRPGTVLDRDYAAALVIEARALAVAGASHLRRDGPLLHRLCGAVSPPYETGSPSSAATLY